MPRVMEIVTPLGDDVLLFYRMRARDELSQLSEYQLDLLSTRGDIELDKILGQNVTVKLELPEDKRRFFNGYVTRFSQVGMQGRYHLYQATVRPWLWLLTRTANCRIFQELTVPEIVAKVFDGHPRIADVKQELTGDYRKWEYCVQYRETDFNFVSRLLEQEGIYYYFRHVDGRHTLNLTDSISTHARFPGYDSIAFVPQDRAPRQEQERIGEWSLVRQIRPGRYVIDDYDFKKPSVDLQVKDKVTRKHELADYEIYDYPGEYVTVSEGEHYVRARIEELHADFESVRAAANARGICSGHVFELTGHPRADQNAEYLVVSTQHYLEFNEYESMEGTGASFDCDFTVINSRQPFRPLRRTPKPAVQGPQTAVVVGPAGDEIHTDQYGRVKVQFHWDREGEHNENSSCWIRVSHPWAGKNWGMVALPRIGQEVIVDFLEGDPDAPIITGRVYNAEQMPPYELPANMTQTGIKSRSSKGGGAANFNEIRFEDRKGSEQVYIHAEKNQDIVVENDETHSVGHDRTKTIDHDETTQVGHDRSETVGNNETIAIGVDRTENVGSNETIGIGVNRTETVGSNETVTVGSNRSITVGASETKTVALQRTHTVGVNETIAVGAAQEIGIGAFQALAVGAYQTVNVGAYQNVSVGANRSIDVGANLSTKVGSNLSTTVGADESRSVSGGRSSSVGKDDALKVTNNLVIDAGDSVTIKTGSASISMKKDGTIVIKGKDIQVEGSGKVNVKASSDVVIKGSKILQN